MEAGPNRSFATVPFLVGLMLLLCALMFYYFAVLKIDYYKTALLNLDPQPDAVEYFGQAKGLLRDGSPSIQIGYDKLPSRYPFGYPTLMLSWLKILPEKDSILAPFRTNQTLGLLLLLGVFGFYLYLAMPLAGGCAALLLATLPGFFNFCRSSMSDISASAFIVLAFVFAYLGLKEERRWKIYLSAVLLGLSLNIRVQSLFFAPMLLAMALFPVKGERLRWFLHCAALPMVFALAASPLLMLNAIQFHSPFRTGYDFWLPATLPKDFFFSPRYIPSNAALLWREFALRPQGSHIAIANTFGTGTNFVPAFVLLICFGLFFIRLGRFVICALAAGLNFFIVLMSHNYELIDLRYFLPLLMISVAVAVLPVTWAIKNVFAGKRMVAALAVFALFAAACLGFPSRFGYNTTQIGRSQAWDALHFAVPPDQSNQFIAQRHFLQIARRQPGIVFSDIDPVYLHALLPEAFIAAPIDGKHNYDLSAIWHYDHFQALALAKRGLDQLLPIYALFVSRQIMNENMSRLPAFGGYQWSKIKSGEQAAVLRLVPADSQAVMRQDHGPE